MNRYIKLEAVLDRIAEAYSKHNELVPMWLHIGDIPYADVVEVVRCKDCKYAMTQDCPMDEQYEDDYCSYGERKEQEYEL